MEPRKIFIWSFLYILFVSMMSTGCQAQELIEVNASDILEQIENGEDIYLENVRITGELNLNDVELETLPIERSNLQKAKFDLNDELKVVKSKITIVYSVFENDVDFSNTQFNEALDFNNTSFTGETDLSGSSFIQSTNFQKANFNRNYFILTNFHEDTDFQLVKFNNGADFRWAKFYADANFEDASFNYDAMFNDANFNFTSFKDVIFDEATYFSNASFNGDAKFWNVNFKGPIDFKNVNFNNNTYFSDVTFSGRINFRNAKFNKTIFSGSIFNSNSYFINANFNSNTDFTNVDFSEKVQFNNAMFIGEADFNYSNFNSNVDFNNVNFSKKAQFNDVMFNGEADFMDASFNGDANFGRAKFGNVTNFMDASFDGDADFRHAKFGYVDFSRTDFNKNVDFHFVDFQKMVVTWSSLEDGLTCDGLVYIKLIKYFRDRELFDDADKAYYQYRKESQKDKNGLSLVRSEIMRLACGYGVRPDNAVVSGLFLSFILFPIIYMLLGMSFLSALECSCVTFITGYNYEIAKSNKFTNSYRLQKKIVEWLPYDFLNKKLSWLTHARLVKFALICEGLFGWLILALFIVTLANVTIRP